MSQDGKQKLNTLLFGLAFSLPVGLIFSSLYVTLKHDRGSSALAEFDIFAFWYETPFYLGHFTGDFYTGLFIVGVTALSAVIAPAVPLLKTKYCSTALWARFQKLRGDGLEATSDLKANPEAEEPVEGYPWSLSDGTCNSTEERHQRALELERIQQEKARQNKMEAEDHPPAADQTPVQGEAPLQGRREIPTEPRQNASALKTRQVLLERIKSVHERNRLMSEKNRHRISS